MSEEGLIEYDDFFASVSQLAKRVCEIHREAATQIEPEVRHLIETNSRDEPTIERTLDRLLDVCGDATALQLYRQLCRHYWSFNQSAAASYVDAYREMWEGDET